MEKDPFSNLTTEQLQTIQSYEKEFQAKYGQTVSLVACKQQSQKNR